VAGSGATADVVSAMETLLVPRMEIR